MQQRVDVHESEEQVMGLVEAGFLTVEADHEGSLQGLEGQTALAPGHEAPMDLGVEDGVELLLLLAVVGHFVGADALIRFPLKESFVGKRM